MNNVVWAKSIVDQLLAAGVDEFLLCPGARNAPFVEALAKWQNAKLHSFFEERSAGFFALGRSAESGRPKAVITTSGTAVANLLPAVIEAHYAGIPLVVVTADRPKTYRGSGAPQTIVQPGIFGGYADDLGDLECGENLEKALPLRGAAHLNVCFDEPLITEPAVPWLASESESVSESVSVLASASVSASVSERPLIIVGGLPPSWRASARTWLKRQSCPMFLEAMSGLRGDPDLAAMEIRLPERALKPGTYDSVVRLGRVPTHRIWRDLEKSEVPVFAVSDLPFSGLSRFGNGETAMSLDVLQGLRLRHPEMEKLKRVDQEAWSRLEQAMDRFPRSEPALIRQLSRQIAASDRVYLGNSLPIREWDLAARRDVCFSECFGNRGVNGIDGQLSTFFGWSRPNAMNWAIVGDLTALYDLSSPWALRQRPVPNFRLVIINNGGGKIFHSMFGSPLFENRHDRSFVDWAKMWDLSYQQWIGEGVLKAQVIEVTPDAEQTEAFRKAW